MLCGVLVCVKSRLTAISSTANYVLPALCVHSNFTNPGNCCHWSKLLPGRNKEAEQKWHGLISYYELWVWMDTDLCQLDIWWRFKVKVAINFCVKCCGLSNDQCSLYVPEMIEMRNSTKQIFSSGIHIVSIDLMWNDYSDYSHPITYIKCFTVNAPNLDD